MDIWFYASKLKKYEFLELKNLNNTKVESGQQPRMLTDIDRFVKGYGREYIYEATEKNGSFFDPSDQTKCKLVEVFEGYLNYQDLFYT